MLSINFFIRKTLKILFKIYINKKVLFKYYQIFLLQFYYIISCYLTYNKRKIFLFLRVIINIFILSLYLIF